MEISQAVLQRHAVRSYQTKEIPQNIADELRKEIANCNEKYNLHIQLALNEPHAFDSFMARYGKFSNVQNYIALIGEKSKDLDEKIGYAGEKIALLAGTLGLNTCWVAMSFSKGGAKKSCRINKNEKLVCVLALGYGTTQGVSHNVKKISDVCADSQDMPEWYEKGIKCALLAPTAVNQQKFMFSRSGNNVSVKSTGGFYSKVDLGIVKYHFEIGAGKENFTWA